MCMYMYKDVLSTPVKAVHAQRLICPNLSNVGGGSGAGGAGGIGIGDCTPTSNLDQKEVKPLLIT